VNLGVAVAETDGILTVKEVVAGSPADNAGIAVGAQLLEFDGKKLASVRDYLQALKKCKPGQTVHLKIRGGEAPPAEIPVTLNAPGEGHP
jgi:S1-C subfamily serine protease